MSGSLTTVIEPIIIATKLDKTETQPGSAKQLQAIRTDCRHCQLTKDTVIRYSAETKQGQG